LHEPVLGVFTSGTTGNCPKLVVYSRENILSSIHAIAEFYDARKMKSLFCYPQPFHVFGLVLGYVMAQEFKLNLYFAEGRYSSESHRQRNQVKDSKLLTLGTPTHFYDLCSYQLKSDLMLTPSYSTIIGGASVSTGLWKRIRKELQIEAPCVGYGCTEASPGMTHHRPGQLPFESGEIGYALSNVELNISPGQGVQISGAGLASAIIHEGRLHFPKSLMIHDDLKTRADGMLVYQGRTDLVLNRGGLKISLERIEEILKSELKMESLCCALPDERLGQTLGILIKQESLNRRSSDSVLMELKLLLKAHLDFDCPEAKLKAVEAFPLNINAKPDRGKGAMEVMHGPTS
jgi:acyl-CoA synthetase (AMP-forming)/AMP-acid ligase II